MLFLFGLLSSSQYVSAQLRVIDNKGTISLVDESKWTRIGVTNNIYNKFLGNVGIGTINPVATLHNAGSTLFGTLTLTNFAANGAIGTAAATVDSYTSINIPQTTSGITLTLPVPTNTTAGRILQMSNSGTSLVTVGATLIGPAQTAQFVYNGTTWTNPTGIASSVPFSGLTNASALNTVDNTMLAQTWGWTTATTQNPLTINANALTTGTLLGLNANALTSGTAFSVTGTGTTVTGNLFRVQSASTSAFSNGGVRLNFSGAHTGSGFQIDDVTTSGTAQSINATGTYTGAGLWNLNANAATTGTVANINANALTSGTGLALTGTGTAVTGNLFRVQTASTSAFSNGGVRFNFSGAHTGNGFQLDDASSTGNAMQINANAITTGSGLNITSSSALNTSTIGLLRVANTAATTTGTVFRAQSNSTAGTGLTVLASGNTGLGISAPVATLHNAGSTLYSTLALTDFAANGTIGTAAATVDVYTSINIPQTTAGITLILPTPTNTTAGRILQVSNTGTTPVTVGATLIGTTQTAEFVYNGAAWTNHTAATSSVPFSSLTNASAINTVDNTTLAQTWGWTTATTHNPLTLNANALTTGTLLGLNANALTSGTGLSVSGASAITGSLGDFVNTGSSNSTNGLLRVFNNNASATGTVFRAQSNSTAGTGLTVLANGNTGLGSSAPVATLHNAGSTLFGTLTLTDFSANGAIGSAAATVDSYTSINIPQSTAGVSLTIPSPSNTTAGRILKVSNSGTTPFTIGSALLEIAQTVELVWNGTAWSLQTGGLGWSLTGNGGAIAGTNFLGTTTDVPMNITSNNTTMLQVGRRQTLGLYDSGTTGLFPYNQANNAVAYLAGGSSGVSALQFQANAATFYKPIMFTDADGNFMMRGSAAGTDFFELGSAGSTNNNGQLIFTIGDDGDEPMIFRKYNYTTQSYIEMMRLQGTGLNNDVRVGINTGGVAPNSTLQIDDVTTTGAVQSINATGVYTGTGLWNLNANAATTGTIANINANALTSGTALAVSGASAITGSLGDFVNTGSSNSTNGLLRVFNNNSSSTGTVFRAQSNSTAGTGLTVLASGNTGFGTSAPVATLHNAGSTLFGTLDLTNFAANGAIGTATATVDAYTSINIPQTTASITLTLPTPTNTTAGRILKVSNTGTSPVTVGATLIGTAQTAEFVYNGTAWTNPVTGGSSSSIPFSGLTNASAINTVDNATLAQTWGWTTATTQNPLTINANALTTGTLLGLNANALTSGTGLTITGTGTGATGNMLNVQSASTSAFTNGGVRFNFSGAHTGSGFQIDDVTTTGAVQSINATGVYTGAGLWNLNANTATTGTIANINTNALTSGTGLALTGTGAAVTGNLFRVQSASTSAFTNGGVRFNFSGTHTGNGFQIDDITTTGAAQSINATGTYTGAGLWNLNANSATTGTVANINANALTSGTGLALTVTGTAVTGNLFRVQTPSTSAFTNGGVRFNFNGTHTGSGFQIDDVTTTGAAQTINATGVYTGTGLWNLNANSATSGTIADISANALTSGTALSVVAASAITGSLGDFVNTGASNSTNGLLRVFNNNASTSGTVFRAQSNSTAGSGLTVLASDEVGISTDAPNTTLDVDGDVAIRMGAYTAVNGNNNDIAIGNRSFIRITGPTGNFAITGIAGGQDGKMVILYNTTATRMALTSESTSSIAANRINTLGNTINTTAVGGGSVTLIYDAISLRWIVTAIVN